MAVASKKIPAPDLVPVRRALLSVSDKTGLADFAAALAKAGVELISTGGTAKAIAEAGIPVRDVSELTGFPEIMDGRVKTLHPSVHGALLGVRDDPDHAAAMRAHGIEPIDLVVVNLYPFEEVRHSGADYASVVENIDIGGPAMVRASAKNHAYVAIVTDPEDYASVLNALEMNIGSLSLEFRQKLAAKAFARTAAYDAAISGWFAETLDDRAPGMARLRRPAGKRHALRREPAPAGRLLCDRRQAAGRRHSAPASGQAAVLQQHQRHRRRLRTRRRVRSNTLRRSRHHQTRQPLRRRRRRDADRSLREGARLRPGLGVRRHRRAQPPARRRSRGRDRQDLHRGDHRAGRDRGSAGDRRGEEEFAAAGRRRPARPARDWPGREVGRRRTAGAGPGQFRRRRSRAEGCDEASADDRGKWPT